METSPGTGPEPSADHGRRYFWTGLGVCLLGIALAAVQYGVGWLVVPWYVPALTTLGAVLLLVALARRRSVGRGIALVLIVALAGMQWFFVGVLSRLPDYEGPARAGQPLPAFRTVRADGSPFTDADLRDGRAHVLTFFRGRW